MNSANPNCANAHNQLRKKPRKPFKNGNFCTVCLAISAVGDRRREQERYFEAHLEGRCNLNKFFNKMENKSLFFLAIFSFLLNICVFISFRNIHYADETFQVLEPAHRLLFGTGYQSWEWIVGARSWFWPGIVAGLMALGRLGGSDPDVIRLPVTLFMGAASTVPVICAALWGRRIGGMTGLIVTGALSAVWVDQVYLSVHPLSDVIAGDSLIAFLYLANPLRPADARDRLFAAGILAGLTLVLRFQLGPALAVAAAMVCRRDLKARWLPFAMGASIPIAALGVLDWVTLGVPFQSVIANVRLNVIERVSADFGVSPWFALLGLYFTIWGGAVPIFLLAVFAGARRLPVVAVTAGMIFLTFSLIDHKEYRFVYPAIPLLTVLAGIGTTEIVVYLQKQNLPIFSSASSVTLIAVLFWAATSGALAVSEPYLPLWTKQRALVNAFDYLAHRADICGVGLYRMVPTLTPGNAGLRPETPLYQTDQTHLAKDAAGFNALVGWKNASIPDARFEKAACLEGSVDAQDLTHQSVCVWVRPGSCIEGAASAPPVNWPDSLAVPRGDAEKLDEDIGN